MYKPTIENLERYLTDRSSYCLKRLIDSWGLKIGIADGKLCIFKPLQKCTEETIGDPLFKRFKDTTWKVNL